MSRTLRVWLALAMSAGATLLALAVAEPAYAHGSVAVTIHSDGRGTLWAVVTWEDGHPVWERIAAALLAYSQDGQQVGPTSLRQGLAGPGTLRLNGVLAPGVWTVTIDIAEPGVQQCTAVVSVANELVSPRSTTHASCGAAPTPVLAAQADSSSGVSWWPLLGLIPLALIGVAALADVRRRRSRSRRGQRLRHGHHSRHRGRGITRPNPQRPN